MTLFERGFSAPASIQREIDNLQQQLDALELQENDSTQERLELGIQNRL
ncbi:MAG: hypothetical protein LRY69_07140 [Gammaproteobacteria bacterium]|nr:hypothetical protein [Gammaproteobacteria bacterium]